MLIIQKELKTKMIYNIILRPEEGFQRHFCPVCKSEYDCPASFTDGGCDDEDFERTCNNCLGIQIGVDFNRHIKIKDVKSKEPITLQEVNI